MTISRYEYLQLKEDNLRHLNEFLIADSKRSELQNKLDRIESLCDRNTCIDNNGFCTITNEILRIIHEGK